jgi:hypothetical protein
MGQCVTAIAAPPMVGAKADPLRKFNINRERSAFMFSIVWLRLAAWDY